MESIILLLFVISVSGRSVLEPQLDQFAPKCGEIYGSDPAVDGGAGVQFRQPWRVALYTFNIITSRKLTCGGALISEKFVLTSAQCIDGHHWLLMVVRVGDHGLKGLTERYPYEEYRIRRKIVHGNFETMFESKSINDVALLELNAPITYKRHVLPACLPQKDAISSGSVASVSAMGSFDHKHWSQTFSVRELSVQMSETDSCTLLLANHGLRNTSHHLMCGAFSRATCAESDVLAGSPLMQEKDGRYQAVGILSWAEPCDAAGGSFRDVPTVFTNISAHLQWINAEMVARPRPMPTVVGNKMGLLYWLISLFGFFSCLACLFWMCSSCSRG